MNIGSFIPVTGVILAGGRGSRMGGQDKGLLDYRGRQLIEHVISRFAPQVNTLIINANRNLGRYRALGYPVITDTLEDYPGPLAGMLAGLQQATTDHVAFAPCDAPQLPTDLVVRLLAALEESDARVVIAHDAARLQPLHALLHRDCADSLQAFLARGERKAEIWMQQVGATPVLFDVRDGGFQNLNTPAGLRRT